MTRHNIAKLQVMFTGDLQAILQNRLIYIYVFKYGAI